jgi:hypothetical protein
MCVDGNTLNDAKCLIEKQYWLFYAQHQEARSVLSWCWDLTGVVADENLGEFDGMTCLLW